MRNLLILFFIAFLAIVFWRFENKRNIHNTSDNERNISSLSPKIEDFYQLLIKSPSKAEDLDGNLIPAENLVIERKWNGYICKTAVKNRGKAPLHMSNIILFDIPAHGLDPESPVYGEGFQMLYQNGGTLANRENIGGYADNKHYNIPDPYGLSTVYGVMTVSIKPDEHMLLGFTSCYRFIGRISYDAQQLQVSIDAEGLELKPGKSWVLEDFIILGGNEPGKLFDQLATEISKNHPPRKIKTIPTGWCSWYSYGPDISYENIEENLNRFAMVLPELKYIQIDDGYQPYMGDWTDPNPVYGDIKKTITTIREKGFEPALWVAPFIAEEKSRIFREHPDWFIKDVDGNPLNSSKIGFGGWRCAPWYVLDGTNPEVQKHLEDIFHEMREKWGINYFKLDANYWGAIHGGVHYEKTATRIEAYRLGMEAVLKGCDKNTIVLGCNAPIWPSLGLVTAMRTSGDVSRDWSIIRSSAFENLFRAWQNGKLWISDPDCVLLTNDTLFSNGKTITNNEWMFHATVIHAVGGLILSGDKASNLNTAELATLRKLLTPTGIGTRFSNARMETAVTDLGDRQYYYFFNWSDSASTNLTIQLKSNSSLTDFWNDKVLGNFEGSYTVTKLAPRSAYLIVAVPN
jgi:alpha-galactosidase